MASPKRPSTRGPTTEQLQDILRDAGLRSTGPRLAVLRQLEGASRPVSHPELAEALAPEGFDRATLYRNLVDLTEAGLVRRGDLGDHVWRFERVRGRQGQHAEGHAHFTCTDCGSVECLPEEVTVKLSGAPGLPRAVSRRAVEVQLRGLCDSCE